MTLTYADANPLINLRLHKDRPAKKPEITGEKLVQIRHALKEEAAMRLVNHASELVHKIYQREKVEDVAQWRDVVRFPGHEELMPAR